MIRDAASNAELISAIKASVEGDEVVLTRDFAIALRGVQAAGMVTIKALPDIKLSAACNVGECANLLLAGLHFAAPAANPQLAVVKSQRIQVEGATFMGDPKQPLDQTVPAIPVNGVWFRWCDDVAVKKSLFRYLRQGVYHDVVEGLLVEDNQYLDMHGDSVRGGTDCAKITIRRNTFRDLYVHGADHLDAIQFWTTRSTKPITDILVEENIIDRGKGNMAPQGIFLGDEGQVGYPSVTIRKNALLGTAYNGISVSRGGPGVLIEENFIQAMEGVVDAKGNPINRSSITLRASIGGMVRGNVAKLTPYQNIEEAQYVDNLPAPPLAKAGDDSLFNEWVAKNLSGGVSNAEIEALKAEVARLTAELEAARTAGTELAEKNAQLRAAIGAAQAALGAVD